MSGNQVDRADRFFADYERVHGRTGVPVRLLVELHPALHHGHLADTVAEVCAVAGVTRVWRAGHLAAGDVVGPPWTVPGMRESAGAGRQDGDGTGHAGGQPEHQDQVGGEVESPGPA